MSAYAATTSRIKLGQMCTAMSYRNPAIWPRSPRPLTSSPAAASRWVSAAAGTNTNGAHTDTGFRRRVCGWRASTRACRSCGTPGATARHVRRQALPGRRGDRRAQAAAGRRDPAVDRRRRREGHPAHRCEVRAVHQLHLRTRGFRAQVAGARRALRDVGTDFGAIVRSANINAVVGKVRGRGQGTARPGAVRGSGHWRARPPPTRC